MATYRIHPGIAVARLGNSPDAFCIAPEEPAGVPLECDAYGNPIYSPDGTQELRIKKFKDDEGRIKRQAARFQVWVFDEQSPEGRPLKIGDPIEGGGNAGTLIDIQWRVYLANKKASWYEFNQLEGEHGYAPGAKRRNADVPDSGRQRLIIDPGPRTVDCTNTRRAKLDRHAGGTYAPTFPPPLQPESIDTVGELITDNSGRLLVLGGHGHSGTYKFDQFGQPRIDSYANNDGWFDDTADGPVMARLVMYSPLVQAIRFVDVEYPAWCITAYPRYVPEILDVVTMEDVVEDLSIREFNTRPELYGTTGTFDDPQPVPPGDEKALILWRAGRLRWNPKYKPWFYRDIWPILFRPNEFSYLCSILGQSNFPHDQSTRGTFDPNKLGQPPQVDWGAVESCARACMDRHHDGTLFVEMLTPTLNVMGPKATNVPRDYDLELMVAAEEEENFATSFQQAAAALAAAIDGNGPGDDYTAYVERWREADTPGYKQAKETFEAEIDRIVNAMLAKIPAGAKDRRERLIVLTNDTVRRFLNGDLLDECRRRCIASNSYDPFRSYRTFLFDLLRAPGEENQFAVDDRPSSRVFNLPLMPLLAGDNPISNVLPSKFLRLTDYQYFLLRQWALGLFFNESIEKWATPDPWHPYAGWENKTARDLDRAVLMNVLGGAFCPGGEVGWIMRNPAIYHRPYRIKADPACYTFAQTAAQANANRGQLPEVDYGAYAGADLAQDNNFDAGLQPGDLTKYMGCPWQADFNECSTQTIDVTYEEWNQIFPKDDALMKREQRIWETLWWPAHRPLQVNEITGINENGDPTYIWVDWAPGVPQTNAGDLKMVTEWWRLGFVVRNPYQPTATPAALPPDQKYINVESTRGKSQEQEERK